MATIYTQEQILDSILEKIKECDALNKESVDIDAWGKCHNYAAMIGKIENIITVAQLQNEGIFIEKEK